jgi:hypothetical protein
VEHTDEWLLIVTLGVSIVTFASGRERHARLRSSHPVRGLYPTDVPGVRAPCWNQMAQESRGLMEALCLLDPRAEMRAMQRAGSWRSGHNWGIQAQGGYWLRQCLIY